MFSGKVHVAYKRQWPAASLSSKTYFEYPTVTEPFVQRYIALKTPLTSTPKTVKLIDYLTTNSVRLNSYIFLHLVTHMGKPRTKEMWFSYVSKKLASALDVVWLSTKIISSQSRMRFISGPCKNACGNSWVKNSSILSRLHDSSNMIVHFRCCKSGTWKRDSKVQNYDTNTSWLCNFLDVSTDAGSHAGWREILDHLPEGIAAPNGIRKENGQE